MVRSSHGVVVAITINGVYCDRSLHQSSMNQGCTRWYGWSGFGRTTISQGKNLTPFYKMQVIYKSTR